MSIVDSEYYDLSRGLGLGRLLVLRYKRQPMTPDKRRRLEKRLPQFSPLWLLLQEEERTLAALIAANEVLERAREKTETAKKRY